MPGVAPTIFIIFTMAFTDCVVDDASGKAYVTNKRPPSSDGTNPDGLLLNRRKVPTQIQTKITTTYLAPLILCLTPLVYLPVTLSNHLLNQLNPLSSQFDLSVTGL